LAIDHDSPNFLRGKSQAFAASRGKRRVLPSLFSVAQPPGNPRARSEVSDMKQRQNLIQLGGIVKSAAWAMAVLAVCSSTSFAAGDAAAGQQVFASRCGVCHATEPGVKKFGPSLAGVFGRKSGSEADFDYSSALKAAAITWDEKTLDQFIENPTADVRGTKMPVGLPGNDDRQNVIAYLKTLKP
jgi:cytochrome c